MPTITREAVVEWIEERRQEGDAETLNWLIREAGSALLGCYPAGMGRAVLWALFRVVAGPEEAHS